MTLETPTHFNGLPICVHCGWPMAGPNEIDRHKTACEHALAGAAAFDLAARLPTLNSTKCGYGTGALTFTIDRELSVTLNCSRYRYPFTLEKVWLLGAMSEDRARDLVRAIAAWRKQAPK